MRRMFTSWDGCLLFSHQNLNDINIENIKLIKQHPQSNQSHQRSTVLFTNKKTFHKHTHTPLSPCLFNKKNTRTHSSGFNQPGGFFFNFSTAFHGPRPGMLERRLGTHQQTALGRLGSFGSGVLGGLKTVVRWIFELWKTGEPCVVLLGV